MKRYLLFLKQKFQILTLCNNNTYINPEGNIILNGGKKIRHMKYKIRKEEAKFSYGFIH